MSRFLFARIALIAACFAVPARIPADLTAASSRKAAPDFTLNTAKGDPVKLSSYKGKVVLLDFWGTFCSVCKVEVPWYVEFQSKYKESGLWVIGVSLDEDGWKSVKPFMDEQKVNYTIAIGNWDLAKLFGFRNELPLTLLIDRNGRIADMHAGMVDKAKFESEIQILLNEPTP
jgi:peroxiredoxin